MTHVLVFAGDSNIAGSEMPSKTLSYLANPENFETIEVGLAGLTMSEAVNYYEGTHPTKIFGQTPLSQRYPDAQTKTLFIGTGTNDVYAATPYQQTVDAFTALTTFYQAHGYQVYPITTLPVADYHNFWINATVQLMMQQWQTAGWSGIIHGNKAPAPPPSSDYAADNIHILPSGDAKVARLIAASLADRGLARLKPMYIEFNKATYAENDADFLAFNAKAVSLGAYPNAAGTSDYARRLVNADGIRISAPVLAGILNQYNRSLSVCNDLEALAPGFVSRLQDAP
ncbi:MAG: SGNH/GDSL hydrolase family protein [Vampirovibrionales bacterium]|nr:SGNH/GDSL hydrolase family protein [Vampirovibrionales bacterium]